MTWTVAHPVLYFLPLLLCLLGHIFLSAGFLLGTKQGFLRFSIYLVSCLYVLGYLLLFNQGLTLTTTKINLDFPGRYLKYENHYGIVRIPVEQLQLVCVEGSGASPSTVWIQSQRQVFYLDQHFPRREEFLPLLQSFVTLSTPQLEGEFTVYRVGNFAGPVNLNPDHNILRGSTTYFLPWLAIFPLLAYLLAAQAWQGKVRFFQILAVSYSIPLIIIGLFCKPSLPLITFLILYPFYPIFLSAMCLPDSK